MTARELICSGKLELFVAGSLAKDERAKVAACARRFPEVALEIQEIQFAMLDYAPPEEAQMDADESNVLFDKIYAGICKTGPEALVTEDPRQTDRLQPRTILIAAAMMGLIITTCSTVWLALKNRDLRAEMASLMSKQSWSEQGSRRLMKQIDQLEAPFALMRTTATKRIELRSVKGSNVARDSYMLVYWNPLSEKLLLAGASLPGLAGDHQYHLWALNDGKPLDAGVFDVANPDHPSDMNNQGMRLRFQKDIPCADAFAVTIEPKGGSKSPSLTHLCLMAKL